jgi:adenosylcobinamide-GDP ribazoletransferase
MMRSILRRFILAISFLTVLPVDWLFIRNTRENQDFIKDDLSKSSIFFPIVGMLIGFILAGTNYLLQYTPFDFLLSTGITLIIWVFLSGGLHLEGFADMVDGFSGGKNQKEIIRIMKDGAIGSKGAIALILLILLKLLLIYKLHPFYRIEALLLSPVIGRWSMVLAGYFGKPASSDNSLSQMFTLYLGEKEIILATIITISYGYYLLSYYSLYFLVLSGFITYLLISYSSSKMQGICGDVIGAVNEISEVSVLFLFFFFYN